MSNDISIIVLAFNEEKNIESAIDNVIQAIKPCVSDYEILVVNDGSRDTTGTLTEAKAKENPKVKVIHNEVNRGYGYSYRRALALASKTYATTFSGDNDMTAESLQNLLAAMGTADVICNYYDPKTNQRGLLRKMLSKSFAFFINTLFGLHLKYTNGSCLCLVETLRQLALKSDGLAINTEILVKLLKSGCSYKEVPLDHIGRHSGKSTALTLRSLKMVLRTISILIKDVYLSPSVKQESAVSCL